MAIEVGLLAGGAAWRPNPDLVVRALAREQLRNDLLRQSVESVLVAEKRGNADQQIMEELDDLLTVFAQPRDVIIDIPHFEHLHAALNPAQERSILVAGEIVAELVAQDVADRLARLFDAVARGVIARGAGVERAEALHVFDQLAGHVLDRNLQIDRARGDRVGRHIGVARRRVIGLLGDR